MRTVIFGGPKTGKTTLSDKVANGAPVYHGDDLIGQFGWSEASEQIALWLDREGDWVIEGVQLGRALRKWLASTSEGKPCDVIYLNWAPFIPVSKQQAAMGKGCQTTWKEIEHVGVATETTVPLPILGSVLIDFQKGSATFSTTNLELYISEKVTGSGELNVKQSGSACVSFRLLKQFVARAESKSVLFELRDKKLLVSYGQNVASLEMLPAEEFPEPFKVQEGNEITCNASSLTEPLAKVFHSVCQDQNQFAISGVNIHRNSAGSEFAATDKHRISICKSAAQIEGEDFIIPRQMVKALIDLLETGQVKLRTDRQVLIVESENLSIQGKLLEATYPKYQSVIPEPSKSALNAHRKELIEAVQTASIFMRQNEIEIQLRGKGKELEVACFDRFKTKLIASELEGQPNRTVRINHRYLLEALQVCESDTVRIEVGDHQPLAIREGQFIEAMNPLIEVGSPAPKVEQEEKVEEAIPF